MNELLVRMLLDLFKEVSYKHTVRIGFSVAPKRFNTTELTSKRNFMYVEMVQGETTVEIYRDVDEMVRIGEVEEIRATKECMAKSFGRKEEIELPSNYMVITFYEVVTYMRNSDSLLERERVEVTSSTNINHTVQILEKLFSYFGNKMIFTIVSDKFPGELLTIHYVNRSACLLRVADGVATMEIINLFRFREVFGNYQILTVGKVNIPKNFVTFVNDAEDEARSNNLIFKEESYD